VLGLLYFKAVRHANCGLLNTHPFAASSELTSGNGQMTTGNVLFMNTRYNLLNATGICGTQI
jgi:hypothetical protein